MAKLMDIESIATIVRFLSMIDREVFHLLSDGQQCFCNMESLKR